ncbi:MAG: relaxase/mobilization nuclease domain-containing protein [Fusobacterium periodonticum]|nr:relaxase/mobilization nuclease domain-containing protein [Fusobacterium periodonticum]
MPIFKAVEIGKGIGAFRNVLDYLVRKNKAEEDKKVLISGIGVSNDPTKALKQMIYNKLVHNKLDKEALYKQFTQSYDSKDRDKLTPELVHKMGVLFAEENFEKYGFKCVVVTHFEKDHIHNHFFVDNVNIESGLKYTVLDDRHKNTKQYKKRIEQGKLKNHERMLEDLKKSSDDISFFYGIDRVEKGDKSINLYDKKLYKSVESGFLGKVIRNWNEILYDKTTNLSNFVEVLQSKGIYAKVDNHEVYFSKREIKDPKQDNYVRLSYLESLLNYQFKQSETENTFAFKKSMELLNKEKIKEKNIREVAVADNNRSNGKEKEKAEVEKEVQLNLKKQGLINLIKEYKKEIGKTIESYYTSYRIGEDTEYERNFKKEFNAEIGSNSYSLRDKFEKETIKFILVSYKKSTENINKKVSADFLKSTLKKSTSFFAIEELAKTEFVAENSSTENTKRILTDKYFQTYSSYEIEKMNEKKLEQAINEVSKTFNNAVANVKNYIENTKEYHLKSRVEEIFKTNLEEKNNIDIEKVKEDLVNIYKNNNYYFGDFADIPKEVVKLSREYEEKQEKDRQERIEAYMEKFKKKKNDDYEYTYSSSSTSTPTKTTTTTVDREEKNALEEAIRNQRLAEEERLRDLANAESNKKKVKSVIVEDKGNKGKDREIE